MAVRTRIWRLIKWLTSIWRSGCRAIGRGRSASPAEQLLLRPHLLLLRLQSRSPRLDQGGLDRPNRVGGKDRSFVYRTRHGLLPRLQHLLHLSTGRIVDRGIGVHERLVQILAEEQGVGSADVLHDRIQQIDKR